MSKRKIFSKKRIDGGFKIAITISFLIVFILAFTLIAKGDWTPTLGNMDMRDIYNVTGVVNMSAAIYCDDAGNCKTLLDLFTSEVGGDYLYNTSTAIYFNETKSNATYYNVVGDTLSGNMDAGDYNITNIGTADADFLEVSQNLTLGNTSKTLLCTLYDDGTNIVYNCTRNINFNKNISMGTQSVCFGDSPSDCDGSINWNGTALRIKVS